MAPDAVDDQSERGVRAYSCSIPEFGPFAGHPLESVDVGELTTASGLDQLLSLPVVPGAIERYDVDVDITAVVSHIGVQGSNEVWIAGPEGGMRTFDIDLDAPVGSEVVLEVNEVTAYDGMLEITGVDSITVTGATAPIPVLDVTREPLRAHHVGQMVENFGIVAGRTSGDCEPGYYCYVVTNESTSFTVAALPGTMGAGDCVHAIGPVVDEQGLRLNADPTVVDVYASAEEQLVCSDAFDGNWSGDQLNEGRVTDLVLESTRTEEYRLVQSMRDACTVEVTTMNRVDVSVTIADRDRTLHATSDRGVHIIELPELQGTESNWWTLSIETDGAAVCTEYQVEYACESTFYPADDIESGELFITELMANPPNGANEPEAEWIEVYNAGDDTLDLHGLMIIDQSGDVEMVGSTLEIGPGEYRWIANADPQDWVLPETPDVFMSLPSLNNGGDRVFLFNAGGELDERTYSSSSEGTSLQLSADALDTPWDDDRWCASTESFGGGQLGTPGAANTVCE